MELLNKFLKKDNYLISFFYFPFIYLLGWIIISILTYPFPNLIAQKSLYGTVITFIIFLVLLPNWFTYKWNKNFFKSLGINKLNKEILLSYLIFEFFKAFFIILLICLIALIGGYATFFLKINNSIIFNGIFLGLIVGFAEELVFRVWLFEELHLFFKKKYANLLQAIIFSLAHLRWDYDIWSNSQLLIGLFLLGLYLNKWREYKNPCIFIPIFFHSSIVSIWFFISSSFINIQPNIPKILFGPGKGSEINPIGGMIGIVILFILCFQKSLKFTKYKVNKIENQS